MPVICINFDNKLIKKTIDAIEVQYFLIENMEKLRMLESYALTNTRGVVFLEKRLGVGTDVKFKCDGATVAWSKEKPDRETLI